MDKDLGRIVAGTANHAARELGDLALLIKGHCAPEEQEKLGLAIGSAVYEAQELMNQAFELCPGLREEFVARCEKYGRNY